ncbi:MAG: MATE family efflux transporter, partial [Parabacteroides sp.]|nr:MATE family efflux transporter [Parabacteroides sp.]
NRFTSFDFSLLKRVLGISVFTMMQYFLSMGSWFMFFVVVERIGTRDLAIANIVRSVYIVMVIPVSSLSTTANTFVSNAIGAGNSGDVMKIINKIARLSFYIMAVFVFFVVLFPKTILSVYTNDPQLIADAVSSIYVISAAMLISSVGSIYFSGVTGTGNTRSALLMEVITLVFYGFYIYVIGIQLNLPVEVCFTTELVYYIGLFAFSVIYLKKGSWQHKKI